MRNRWCLACRRAASFAIIPEVLNSAPKLSYRQDTPLHQLQQEFIDLRFGMFLHYNMATYQDREWGDPRGDVQDFVPTALDTDQWARAAISAGMTYGCLTTKHHDGFCLWPTETTSDHVLGVDVVRAYAESFRRAGLQVGFYYSILDLRSDIRHHNITRAKIDLIKDHLTELLTGYGPINILVIDGWDAPWSRITYEEVPFSEIYAHIKELQPNCLVCDLNASEYPASALYYTDIKAFEQNAGQYVPEASALPALSCVTLTTGWFWKLADEQADLKSVEQVVHEWLLPLNTRYCNVICNAAPNREGRLSPNLVRRLEEIGRAWSHAGPMPAVAASPNITAPNLAAGRPIHASFSPDTVGPDMANDGCFESAWFLPDSEKDGWIEIEFPSLTAFNTIVLVEPIGEAYPESRFGKWSLRNEADTVLASGSGLSPVHIVQIDEAQASRLRFVFVPACPEPHLAEIGVYLEPKRSP